MNVPPLQTETLANAESGVTGEDRKGSVYGTHAKSEAVDFGRGDDIHRFLTGLRGRVTSAHGLCFMWWDLIALFRTLFSTIPARGTVEGASPSSLPPESPSSTIHSSTISKVRSPADLPESRDYVAI